MYSRSRRIKCQIAHYEERRPKIGLARHTERLPQGRLDHRHKERRKEERNSSEDGALAFHILAPIILEYLIDNPVPASLGGNVAGPLSMRVVLQPQKYSLRVL